MNIHRLVTVLALAAAPFAAIHAQVLRDPGNVGSASPADLSTAVDAGRRAQQDFENFTALILKVDAAVKAEADWRAAHKAAAPAPAAPP